MFIKHRKKKCQVFAYLTDSLVAYLTKVRTARDLKSRSSTIAAIIEDHQKLYHFRIKEYLESEAGKRGIKANDLMATAIDLIKDLARGVK